MPTIVKTPLRISFFGGGGFFIFLAPPDAIPRMQDAFGAACVVKSQFQEEGSRLSISP